MRRLFIQSIPNAIVVIWFSLPVAAAPSPERVQSFTQSNACHKYVIHFIIDYCILLLSYTLNKSSIFNGKHSTRSRYARAAKCRKFRTCNKFYKLIDFEINSFVCCFRSFQVRMLASLPCCVRVWITFHIRFDLFLYTGCCFSPLIL